MVILEITETQMQIEIDKHTARVRVQQTTIRFVQQSISRCHGCLCEATESNECPDCWLCLICCRCLAGE